MLTPRAPQSALALSAAAALLLTACNGDAGGGQGDTEALSGIETHINSEDELEVLLNDDAIETDELSSRVLSEGDGEEIDPDQILEFQLSVADPQDGGVIQDGTDYPMPEAIWLPAIGESEQPADQFIYEALTDEGVTLGSEVAVFIPADPEAQLPEDQLLIFEPLQQYSNYADGEVQEQSGDLPEIDTEIGLAPELVDHDTDSEAPEELTSEVLISGEGEEVDEGGLVLAQYRGWRWEDGEQFDASWPEDNDGEPGAPVTFPLEDVIEGWTEGLPGHQVGDRVLLVIPADQAYGETEDEEEGTTAGGGPGGALIFVVDILQAFDAETYQAAMEYQAEMQPQPEQQPQGELSEEEMAELEEMMEQMEQDGGIEIEEPEQDGEAEEPAEEEDEN